MAPQVRPEGPADGEGVRAIPGETVAGRPARPEQARDRRPAAL
jgi:hypothetical protein